MSRDCYCARHRPSLYCPRADFADDTYVISPATNADSRQVELKNIDEWSGANNLKP